MTVRPLSQLRSIRHIRLYALAVIGLIAISATVLSQVFGQQAQASQGGIPTGSELGLFGAPVQNGVSGPDSATSFNSTLPNGRRVTPLGSSVQVGENPLGSALTPDARYLIVTNDDERNSGALNTNYSGAQQNGAGQTPGGFTLSVVRTADMRIVGTAKAPVNPTPNPGPKAPGKSQSDKTASFFLGVAVKADPAQTGAYLVYASGGPSDVVNVYSLSAAGALTLVKSISVPVPTDPTKPNYGMAAPGGLTLSADGSKLYVVNNNANTVVTIDTATNTIAGSPIAVGYFPYAGVLAPDGSKLYVSNWGVADRSFNAAHNSNPSGAGSLDIAFANPQTDPARSSSVSVVNLDGNGSVAASVSLARPIDGVNIVGGTHPSALAIVASHDNQPVLYVADANDDSLALINTHSDTLVRKVLLPSPLTPSENVNTADNQGDGNDNAATRRVLGLYPNALAVSPDNTRLYVAEAGLNSVAVYDVQSNFQPRFLGRIPTGWYPTGVTISPDGKSLYVVNAKGLGSDYRFKGAVPGSPDVNLLFGTVQKVDLASLNLPQTTRQVTDNTYRLLSGNTSVISKVAPQIQHVIYILRENKTYDTYFGNDAVLNGRGANGNPAYAQFDAQVPNTKALAEQFAIGDNFYADAEESDAGHSFALAGTSTDYQQKTLLSRFSRPFINTKNEDPEDYPLMGYIFNSMARHGVSYANYGDMIRLSGYDDGGNPNPCADDPYPGCDPATYSYKNTTAQTVAHGGLYTEDVPALKVLGDNHTDPNYPGWNLRISDQRRANEFIQHYGAAIQAGTAPRFTFIWLPDDHTGGGLDPRFEVADNDAALGKIVDFISHSSIWPHTAIFVTEDDAQGSPDHVNAHRTYSMVISPYAKRQAVVHRLSSTVGIPKTIEELLGLPPMNLGDLVANDLSDYFTTTPDLTPYTIKAPATAFTTPAEALRIAALTSALTSSTYDAANRQVGQVTALYFRSLALYQNRDHIAPADYTAQQDALYTLAQQIVGVPVRDSDG